MRMCERNLRLFYHAEFVEREEVQDEYGNYTGEGRIIYSDPMPRRANISPAKGTASVEMFGSDLNYTKTLVVTDMNCPIDENSILWVDNIDTEKPHDYVVVGVARSINNISYAIKKVDVNEV